MTCSRFCGAAAIFLALLSAMPATSAQDNDRGSRRFARQGRSDDRDRDRDRGEDRDRDRDRDRGGRRPPVARAVRIGTTVSALPRGHREVVVRGTRYYVYESVCYARGPRPDTYVVVRPPLGLSFTHIPSDYVSVQIGGASFYYYDDCYYDDRLTVVDCPIGGTITQLGISVEVVEGREGRYYRDGDRFFKAVIRGGKTIYERVSLRPDDLRPASWETLGSAKISFRGELESIPSSLRRGRFHQMRIEVTGGDVEIYDLAVRFANGEIFSPNIRQNFDENTRSRIIDLPGDERFIKEVVFRAKSRLTLAGKATISISVR